MSYNIDVFKVKRLEDFRIPVASLYKHERSDWHPERRNNDDGTFTFEMMEGEMSGVIENDVLLVHSINCSGEGSGTSMDWILEPAFKESTGILIASCIWEAGDTINQLRVENGEVEWVNIEI